MSATLFGERTFGFVPIGGSGVDTNSGIPPSTQHLWQTNPYKVIEHTADTKRDADINKNPSQYDQIDKPSLPIAEEIAQIRALINPAVYQEQVLKHTPGSSTYMTATFDDGDHFISFARVLPDRSISLNITEVTKKRSILSIQFRFLENGDGWGFRLNGQLQEETLSIDTPLDSFSFLGVIIATAVKVIESKDLKSHQSPQEVHTKGMCVGHDMVCSNFPLTTDDRLHVTYWAPCIDLFDTYIEHCCKEHDRAEWCAHGYFEYKLALSGVIKCIQDAVNDRAYKVLSEKLNKLKWPAKAILWIICAPLMAAWLALTEAIIEFAVEAYFEGRWYDLILSDKKDTYLNLKGQHDDSCLCHPSRRGLPTWLCDNECRDLCKEFGRGENCTDCGCVCDYKNGKLIGAHFKSPSGDEMSDLGCCPGTGFLCRGIDVEKLKREGKRPCDDFTKTCPTCFDCHWECEKIGSNYGWIFYSDTSGNDLPCCRPTPKPIRPCEKENGRVPYI